MEKLPHGQSFISTLKTISKINHLSLKDEQATTQSKLIPDLESPIKDSIVTSNCIKKIEILDLESSTKSQM